MGKHCRETVRKTIFVDENGVIKDGCASGYNAYKTLPQKRIHYKTPTYTKSYENYITSAGDPISDTQTWGRMNELYTILANFFPFSLEPYNPDTHTCTREYGILRMVKTRYTAEKYEYKGKMYTGQVFTVRQAEIVGTQDLGIEERLYLHETLLEYLDNGYRLEQLNQWIEELVNYCLQGFTASTIILALLLSR